MFRLVGPEIFHLGRFECKLDVEPDGTFGLLYNLSIDSQSIEEFRESCKKKFVSWIVRFSDGTEHRLVFGTKKHVIMHSARHNQFEDCVI